MKAILNKQDLVNACFDFYKPDILENMFNTFIPCMELFPR